jgi:3-oxoacyl-[acyl-carrier protein] reductase
VTSFTGRRVLVIGAGGGIGAPLAAALEAAGAEVVAADAPVAARSPYLVADPGAPGGGRSPYLVADLREPGAAASLVRRAWDERGPIDALVHVAGLYPALRAMDSTEELFDTVMAVNTRSALLAATTLAALCERDGRKASLVFTSSGAARGPRPGTTVYAASKAALEAVTRGLALELAPLGLRVNAVAPGYVDVGSSLNPVTDDYVAAVAAANPMGRVGTPADIVPCLMWLCHDDSAWVNGHVLAADGGAGLGSPAAPSWLSA